MSTDYSKLTTTETAGFSLIAPAMETFIDQERVSGVLTLLAKQGEVVHCQAQGYADVETQTPIQLDTLFRIYSMTKPITAVAVMILFERGLFSLDDPIAKYLPYFSDMKVHTAQGPVTAKSPITIRQLLTHSSGLTYSMMFDEPAVSAAYDELRLNEVRARLSWSLEEHVKKLAEQPLVAHPGTAWRYSEAMSVLARLVEVVSEKTYRTFMLDEIFTPLGMIDTDYCVPEEKLPRLATLYERGPKGQSYQVAAEGYGGDYSRAPLLEAGGAGLVSTAADYLRFAQMLLNEGVLDGQRLLSPTSIKAIMSDQFDGTFDKKAPRITIIPTKGMGFGFCGYVSPKGDYGWGGWASTSFWVDPKNQVAGLMLTQLIPEPTETLGVMERFRELSYEALSSHS